MFDELGSSNTYSDDFVLMVNNHLGIHQIVNKDGSYNITKNIKDLTAVPISGNTYVYIDSEKIPNYLDYDTEITTSTISGYNVVMDQVRFHFVSGFDFDNFKAVILSIKNTENDGKINLFANLLLAPETIVDLISYNSKPLFLGNALYDRYIDLLVPSIKNINEEYATAPLPLTTFAAAITPNDLNSTAFIYNAPIIIGLAECGTRKTLSTNVNQTYETFEVTEYYEATLSQTNEFDNVGAYVNESTAGDYIEFYLTFNSGFPSDLLSILNARNPSDDWIVIHQISVFEQLGTSFNNTSRFVFFQEDRFDEPNVFRPVLRNANEAVSMNIDYVARLTNRRNGEQIIREASYTMISPKKYGRKLVTIPLMEKPQSQKIYNKLIRKNFEATKLFIEPSLNPVDNIATTSVTTITKTEYVPIFFNNSNISIAHTNSYIQTSDTTTEVVFGPGKLRFILSPFDNVIKLKVFTTNSSSSSLAPVPLDLNVNSVTYRLVFDTDNGKISVDNVNNSNLENLSTGIIAFNVSKKDSEAIIPSAKRTVYMIAASQDGKETLIYTGEWRRPDEQADIDLAIETAKAEADQVNQIHSTLNTINQNIVSKDIAATTELMKPSKAIKDVGVSPVVNRFGVKQSKSIQPNSKNAGKN
jgi:hypothetical protein